VEHIALHALASTAEGDEEDWKKTTARITGLGRYILGGDLKRMLAPEIPTFGTWEDLLDNGDIAIIDLPVAKWGSVARASSVLLINAFISAATSYGASMAGKDRRSSIVFLDEAHLFLTEELERATSMARAADLAFVFGIQTHAQLEAGGPTTRQTLMTNCGNKLNYRESDGRAARFIAETHGMKEEMVSDTTLSESFSDVTEGLSSPGSPTNVNRSAGQRTTLRDVFRFKPEVFMGLTTGHAVAQLTDGRHLAASRVLRTPACRDVPWLADSVAVPADEIAPIPLAPILGVAPDPVTFDRLSYLSFIEDTERENLLAAHCLTSPVDGTVTGLVIWNHRFGFVIDRAALPRALPLLRSALDGAIRVFTSVKHPAPFVATVDVAAAHQVQRFLGVALPFPLPITEGTTEMDVAWSRVTLPTDITDFTPLTGIAWRTRSAQLHAVLDGARRLSAELRLREKGAALECEDAWRDTLSSSAPADDPSAPPRAQVSHRAAETHDSDESDGDHEVVRTGGSGIATPSALPTGTVSLDQLKAFMLADDAAQARPAPSTTAPTTSPDLEPSSPSVPTVPTVPTVETPTHADAPAPADAPRGSLEPGELGLLDRSTDDPAGAGSRAVVDAPPVPDTAAVSRPAPRPGKRTGVNKIDWFPLD
jgi:hypothetical protein